MAKMRNNPTLIYNPDPTQSQHTNINDVFDFIFGLILEV